MLSSAVPWRTPPALHHDRFEEVAADESCCGSVVAGENHRVAPIADVHERKPVPWIAVALVGVAAGGVLVLQVEQHARSGDPRLGREQDPGVDQLGVP